MLSFALKTSPSINVKAGKLSEIKEGHESKFNPPSACARTDASTDVKAGLKDEIQSGGAFPK